MSDTDSLNPFGVELSEKQQKVVDCVLSKKSVFFTGAAGTGKSFLLSYIITLLKSIYKSYEIGVTASTGIAAIAIGGCTLHSYLGLGLAQENIHLLREKIKKYRNVRNRWINTKVLIIDEISMIDSEFFDKVEAIARFARYSKEPFGGIQVIATGDFYQLPPVKGDKFCFEAKSWNQVFKVMIELTEIYRQKDLKFKKILNGIRYGDVSAEMETEIRKLERDIQCPPGIEPTHLYPLRAEVDNENKIRLAQLQGESKFYYSKDIGNEELLDQIKKNCPAPEVLELKIGAQVCLLKNLDRTLINGSLGIVKDFASKDYPIIYFPDSNRLITIGPQEWVYEPPPAPYNNKNTSNNNKTNNNNNNVTSAKRIQIPLILAWALSIHKSQGQTLNFVKVDLSKTFEYGQVYVALSRATSMEGLQVTGFNANKITPNSKVKQFSMQLK